MALFWRTVLLVVSILWGNVALANTTYKVAMEADDVVTRILFDAIGQRFELTIDYVYYPSFAAIIDAVQQGQVDFAANVTYTDQRAKLLDFSSPTNIEYTYLYSLTNARLESSQVIAVPQGTIYGELIARNYPEITLISYSGHEHAKVLLKTHQVDGVVDAINQLKPMLLAGYDAQLLNNQLSIKPVSIVAPKGVHKGRLKIFESYIHSAEIQKRLRQSVKQYQFDLRKKALRRTILTGNLNLDRPYLVKLENVGQYASYSRDGQVTGISADVVQQACEILLLNCNIVSDANETWESMYHDLLEKRIDILAPLVVSEARKQVAEFSDPYYFPEVVMIKREGYKDNVYSNVSELIVEKVGVLKDGFFADLLGQLLPNKELMSYTTAAQMQQALLDGEIDYMANSRANFHKKLRQSNDLLPFVEDQSIGSFYRSDVAIGFAKNETGVALAPLFNRAIKMLDTAAIIEQYDSQPNWRATLQAEQAFSRQSQMLFVLVLGFLIVVAMYLHSQSNSDPLTRLKNRRAMHQRFSGGVSADLTVIYLDINRFKHINDSYGHEVGDQVLKCVAAHISKVWHGYCYRIGGDEFILIGRVEPRRLSKTVDKLSTVPFTLLESHTSFDISLAIGISSSRKMFMSLQEVLSEADAAMYQHKHQTKNTANQANGRQSSVLYLQ